MPILHTLVCPNDIQAGYHRLTLMEVTENGVLAHVKSWKNQTSFTNSQPAVWTWNIPIAPNDLSVSNLIASGELACTTDVTSPLTGGTYSSDSGVALDIAKTRKWIEIKEMRDVAVFSTITWDGSVFDSDPTSIQNVLLAIRTMELNSTTSVAWTLNDNTVRTMSLADLRNVAVAMGENMVATHEYAQAKRALIIAATDVPSVEEITWEN